MTSEAVACTTDQHQLGKGARWDARRDELLRVDILAGHVYRDRVDDDGGVVHAFSFDGERGTISGGGILIDVPAEEEHRTV